MHSFTSFTAFAIVAISLTAAAPAPLAQLNARQSAGWGSFSGLGIFGGTNGTRSASDPAGVIEGAIDQEISELEGISSAVAEAEAFGQSIFSSFEANPTLSAAVASVSAAVASVASEVSSGLPVDSSLPSLAARHIDRPDKAAATAGLENGAFHGARSAGRTGAVVATPTPSPVKRDITYTIYTTELSRDICPAHPCKNYFVTLPVATVTVSAAISRYTTVITRGRCSYQGCTLTHVFTLPVAAVAASAAISL
jgi:hypothetical protein